MAAPALAAAMPYIAQGAMAIGGALLGNAMSKGDRDAAKRAMEMRMQMAQRQNTAADALNAQGASDYQFYTDTYRPVETALVNDAMTGIDPEAMAQRAAINFGRNYDTAQAANAAELRRMGVDPNSGRFAATRTSDLVRRAAAETEAGNVARMNAADTNFARRQAVAGIGGTTAARALNARQAVGAAYGGAGTAFQGIQQDASAGARATQQGVGMMIDKFASLYGDYSTAQAAKEAKAAKAADASGSFADGGVVEGPGTGTSDSIPARLSNGEYVIPAHVVKAKGTEFFDKIIQGVK